MIQEKYKHIAFGEEHEIVDFIEKYKHSIELQTITNYAFPAYDKHQCVEHLEQCNQTYDFHAKVLSPALDRLLVESSAGLSFDGSSQLDSDKKYLYISNHRDIVMDTTLTNYVLLKEDLKMTASAIGDNLVNQPFLKDFARVNRNFLVIRGASPRQALLESKLLSNYIYDVLKHGEHSVWIAQREGRAKDGNDVTQPGLLKMLGLNAVNQSESFLEYVKSLSIVPIAISYEYDPTDSLKLPSLIAQLKGESYTKAPDEDLKHILAGITQPKGGIHIQFGSVDSLDFDSIDSSLPTNKLVRLIAKRIDQAIFSLYKLWPTNYIAFDMKSTNSTFANMYTGVQKESFLNRIHSISNLFGEGEIAQSILIDMYAKPVENKMSIEKLESIL